jgi:hypothetical protein
MEKTIRTTAPAALLYCLFLLQATFSFSQLSVHGNLKALPADPPELDQAAVPWLPFEEDWSTGLFETNEWTLQQNGNWRIAGQVGHEAPSAEFYYNPPVTNYHKALTSRLLSARNLIDGEIYLGFDLRVTSINPTGMEFLKVQVLSDTTWNTVWAYSNASSYDWLHFKLDITDSVKGNTFRFRFLAEGQNSLDIYNWMIDNISVYRKCALPLNFEAEINFPAIDEVLLEWDPPTGGSGNSIWLGWNNGINNDAIGLSTGGSFSVAIRFTPMQLGGYIGASLTKLRFFPYAEGDFVMKVWTGNNASNLILEQPVTTISPGIWNEVILNVPVIVTGETELWFGYSVTHEAGDYPAGIDAGPAVAGFGDMISLDGSTWESMATAYALNYNWNLEGFVEDIDKIHNGKNAYKIAYSSRRSGNQEPYTADVSSRSRSLIYYNIYKNEVFLDSTSLVTYIDPTYVFGNVDCYKVQAVYTDCISDFTDQDCVMIIDKQRPQPIVCYPVPADQTLTIESENELSLLTITNFNYQPVYQTYNLKSGTTIINTSTFGNGIYIVRAIDFAGNIHSSKFIVNH